MTSRGERPRWTTFFALGDSLAEGWGDRAGGERPRSWNDWLADGLRARQGELRYVNLGWRGSTVADVLLDQVPPALMHPPDLVTVTVGANDALRPAFSRRAFGQRLRQVLGPFVEAGSDVVTFAYPLPAQDVGGATSGRAGRGTRAPHTARPDPAESSDYLTRLVEVNAEVRATTQDLGGFVLDFERFAPASEPINVSADRVHPNARGYLLLGHEALRRLLDAGGWS